jgi:hypothetical protein
MRKRKKYNPLKQLDLVGKVALKHSAIGCIAGKDGCQLIDLRSNKIMPATQTIVRLISGLRHQWSILIAVFGIDDNNQKYMKSEELSVAMPIYQADMIDTLNRHHVNLGKRFNHKHLLSYGWLATPYSKEWDEKEAFNLLNSIGAFKFRQTDTNEIFEIQ